MVKHVNINVLLFVGVLIFTLLLDFCVLKKIDSRSLIEDVSDAKEFKKILRTKNNVLVLFTKTARNAAELMRLYTEVAEEVKGQATLSYIDCSGEGKKLCKKLKVSPEPTILKHYKDGEFHKDYDRKATIQSMVNFLKDPSGDMPWEEDETAQDIVHIADASILGKLLHKEKVPVLIMFYAPWCGFCKRLKPEYAIAATELKSHSVLAAMDVNKPENAVVRRHFNITGFPTLLYFESGNLKHRYEGENNKEAIINFMKNPGKQPEKTKEPDWSETLSDVVHLTDGTFDSYINNHSSVLVMFYAPWCGHCKKMKPDYINAASQLKQQNIAGSLAAVDATKEKTVSDRYKITGFPTVKYFKNGEYAFDVPVRTADKIEEFMKNPKEPPPPPPPEVPWHETPSDIVHLDEETFKPFLKRKKNVLVMFYAPWCGHCKKAKPEFQEAAAHYKDDPKVEFSAVDCTVYSGVCNGNDVKGYPTFKYFSYYKTSKLYEGGRTASDFISFMSNPEKPSTPPPPSQPLSPDAWWADLPGSEHLHHLTSETFEETIVKEESVLVMFYASWCGHCKSMKPTFAKAAGRLKEEKVSGIFATVDAIVEKDLASKQGIRGFPTVKYYRNGIFISEYDRQRTVDDLIAFMKNPPTSAKEEL